MSIEALTGFTPPFGGSEVTVLVVVMMLPCGSVLMIIMLVTGVGGVAEEPWEGVVVPYDTSGRVGSKVWGVRGAETVGLVSCSDPRDANGWKRFVIKLNGVATRLNKSDAVAAISLAPVAATEVVLGFRFPYSSYEFPEDEVSVGGVGCPNVVFVSWGSGAPASFGSGRGVPTTGDTGLAIGATGADGSRVVH